MIGRRKASVLPEPVCDCINTSLELPLADGSLSKAGNAARWMDVGLSMLILDERWAIMRGSSPRPENVDEFKGALLGLADVFGAEVRATFSTAGLWVNNEEIIWVGGRELGPGAGCETRGVSTPAVSLRARLGGRSCVGAVEELASVGVEGSLRLAAFFAFTLNPREDFLL